MVGGMQVVYRCPHYTQLSVIKSDAESENEITLCCHP